MGNTPGLTDDMSPATRKTSASTLPVPLSTGCSLLLLHLNVYYAIFSSSSRRVDRGRAGNASTTTGSPRP